MNAMAQWGQVAATVLLGLVGVLVVNSYRRQVKVKLAEHLLGSYANIWEVITAPKLVWNVHKPELEQSSYTNETTRRELVGQMHHWYSHNGNGLMMSTPARKMFYGIIANLEHFNSDQFVPDGVRTMLRSLPATADQQIVMACRVNAQMSRFRTQLKTDLAIYHGKSHLRRLRQLDRDFIAGSGLRNAIPWSIRVREEPCQCGHCGAIVGIREWKPFSKRPSLVPPQSLIPPQLP